MPDGEGLYHYQSVLKFDLGDAAKLIELPIETINQLQHLSIGNTCRHASVTLLDLILNGDSAAYQATVPNQFFKAMPCLATQNSGSYLEPLIIMPQPPSAYELSQDQHHILAKLYRRMENILKHHYNSPVTEAKFQLLKELYNELISDTEPSATHFLESICTYHSNDNYRKIINQHRGFHLPFFHQTRTAKLLLSLEKELQQKLEHNHHNSTVLL